MLAEEVQNKWQPVLEHADLDPLRIHIAVR